MSTDPTPRRVERAAVGALQVATLLVDHDPDEVAAFLKTMTGTPRRDTYSRPRHVKCWPVDGEAGR